MKHERHWLYDRAPWDEQMTIYGLGHCDRRSGLSTIMPVTDIPGESFSELFPLRFYTLMFNHTPVSLTHKQQRTVLAPNSACFWSNDQHVQYGEEHSEWTISWVMMKGEIIERHFREFNIPCNTPILLINDQLISTYLYPVLRECSEYIAPQRRIIENNIEGVFLELARVISHKDHRSFVIPSNVQEIKKFIEYHYAEPITLETLAQNFLLSPTYISSIYKKYYHCGPIEYLLKHRINAAAEMLCSSPERINIISRKVGYPNLFNFSKMFKKYYRCSPSLYRKHHRIAQTTIS